MTSGPVDWRLPRVSMSPLRVGEILELAGRLWSRAIGYMVLGVLVILVPGLVLLDLGIRLLVDDVLIHTSPFESLWISLLLLEFFSIFLLGLAFAVCVKMASQAMFGSVSFLGAVGHVVKRAASLLWVFVLIFLVLAIVTLPVSYILRYSYTDFRIGNLILFLFEVWYLVSMSFVVAGVVLHNTRGTAAIGRSLSLVNRAWIFCFFVYFLVFIMFVALFLGLSLIFNVSLSLSLYAPLSLLDGEVIALLAAPFVIYIPLWGCVNFLLYLHLTTVTDNRTDAEEAGWEMGAQPSAHGLVFRLADPVHPPDSWAAQEGPTGPYGSPAGPSAGPPSGAPHGAVVGAPPEGGGFEVPLPAFRQPDPPTPQAAPPGYPSQAAPPGYPSQAAPPGYPPQAAPPGYPPQAAPPGVPPFRP
ncbi:MAG TPA: hypothetical protein VK277_02980 [Acidimicrobiales bacterium]|nr:hypothetical protein [Acidimicrobiales bacterium]